MRWIRAPIVGAILFAAAAAGFTYSGLFDVSAIRPEPHWRAQLFKTVKDRSIDRRVATSPLPPPLTDPKLISTGQIQVSAMCVVCHGAPGVPKSEIGKGLNPEAPSLSTIAKEQSPARLFWVVKNGIKMTGMPAFGTTQSEPQIWAMVAFLKQLPRLDAQHYASYQKLGAPPPAGGPGRSR
ncbi:MAG TPA: cytochrome c [Thermoanaerobaculia bacterium]|nr:cytochrome c [Thermoanaerobaculia bacterium]